MWLLENFKGLVWLTFYFHWTAVLSDLKKVPNLTIIYSFLGGDVEVEAGIQARDGRWVWWKEGRKQDRPEGEAEGQPSPTGRPGACVPVGIPHAGTPQDGPRRWELWA